MTQDRTAPLHGVKIIEFAGIGPGPFAGMMLADMGADVIRIDRPGSLPENPGADFLARGRRSIVLDLKQPDAVDVALRLLDDADGLIEGLRPGVMERLGLGPTICHGRNPRLIYGRMTGWGQDGPLAKSAGHDLNYIAISGALWGMGDADRAPQFPLNLLGDFGGGGMYLAFGMVASLLKAARTGQGDVVDAAICDGTTSLMAMIYSWRAMGGWQDQRGSNLLDGGAPWYSVYECSDGKWITIGALEPQFWIRLLDLLNLDAKAMGDREDRGAWPAMRTTLAKTFKSQPRGHWVDLLEGSDACFAPVLSPSEAAAHPHNKARQILSDDIWAQPMPAPRFANADTPLPSMAPMPGQDTRSILEKAGYDPHKITTLLQNGSAVGADQI